MSRAAWPAAFAVAAIVLLATLGEGGAGVLAGTILHGVVALVVAAALAWGHAGEGTRVPAGPLGAFLAFVALVAVGAAVAPGFFRAWLVIVEIATFAGVAWLAATCGRSLLRLLPGLLAAGAAAHGAVALVQRLADGAARPPSTFLNVNHLAAWLTAALLVAGGYAASFPGPRRRWTTALLLPAAAALATSGSRGAAVGLVVGVAVLVALSWRRLERAARRGVVAAAAIVVLAAVAGIAVRFQAPDPFPYQRVGIARAAWRLATERPWTGAGPGQFASAAANLNFPVEGAPLRYARVFATPHSDWLRAPAEFGWPAAAALALGLLLAARSIASRWRAGEVDGSAAGAAAAVCALVAQGMVDDLSSRPALVVLAAALLGALLAERTADEAPPRPFVPRLAAAVLVLLAFAVGDLAPYLAIRDGDPGRNPLSPALWASRAETIVAGGGALELSSYLRAREAAEHARRLDPSDARWLLTLARVEGLGVRSIFRDVAGRERVAGLYARAGELARTNALIPLDAALFLRGSGDLEGARLAAERCLELEPNAVAPRLLLAAIALDGGEATGGARARALVGEAEELAARFAAFPRASSYERRLLALDPRDAALLRDRAGREDPS